MLNYFKLFWMELITYNMRVASNFKQRFDLDFNVFFLITSAINAVCLVELSWTHGCYHF